MIRALASRKQSDWVYDNIVGEVPTVGLAVLSKALFSTAGFRQRRVEV